MPIDYVAKRTLQLLLIVFIAVTFNFLIPRLIPGDPVESALQTKIAVSGSCRFSDNHCSEVDPKVETAVSLDANTIVAANNRVETARNTKSLNLTVANKTGFTVLGNIVGGSIVVNNVALDTPWQPLNVFGA